MVIYKAKFPNGKVYIGKTINFTMRKYHHIWGSKRKENDNIIMSKAIKKYGAENIEWEIIYECSSIEEMNQKEIEYIKLYKSTDHKYGYNMVCGGKEDFVIRENFDENYRIDIIRRKLRSNGHDPDKYIVITEDLSKMILDDYSNKIGIRSLSTKYGITRQRLRRFLLSKGVKIDRDIAKIKNTFVPTKDLEERVVAQFNQGKKIKDISGSEGLTIMIVSRILHDSGIRKSKRFKNGKRYDGIQPKSRQYNNQDR